MANSISSVTTGTGGIVLESVDTSGNTNIKSGTTTIVAVSSTGAAVTGTLSASGAITGTSFAGALNGTLGATTPSTVVATTLAFTSITGGLAKTGTFIRDSGSATGTVAYTGIGFKPSAIIFLATITGLPSESVGFTNATEGYSLWIDNTYGTGGGGYANAIYFLRLQAGNGNYQLADISTMDADGFTLSWTRTVVGTGTPTTNISVYYMAFR
jgi:hypothetical protein